MDSLELEIAAPVPYDGYVHTATLHGLQHPRTDDPGEMSFLVITQIMELYFGLIEYELREAARCLRRDSITLGPLRRAALHFDGLNASWQGLRWMTPADFNRFRTALGEASGVQSASYRRLEFRLGLKDAAAIRPHHRDPDRYAQLLDALHGPSLWDETIALLARRGHPMPPEVLDRDFAADYQPHRAVEEAWVRIYRDAEDAAGMAPSKLATANRTHRSDGELRALGESLTEVAERFDEWRYRHVAAVRRAMGAKPGTGGSPGLAWLERRMTRVVFPELWSARTHV